MAFSTFRIIAYKPGISPTLANSWHLTYLGDTAAVALQLVPAVPVIGPNQLVVHVEQVLHPRQDIVADLLGETDRVVGRVGDEDGDSLVRRRSGVAFVVGPIEIDK